MPPERALDPTRRRPLGLYLLWATSLVALSAYFYFYRQHVPELQPRSAADYEAELARYRQQIDELSASVLTNQRELRNTQKELRNLLQEHQKLIEAARKR
jgi:uncharacterized coiled-coil protein SlyX